MFEVKRKIQFTLVNCDFLFAEAVIIWIIERSEVIQNYHLP